MIKSKKPGTTLIEVIVALFVVTTTIVGSVSIISVAFRSSMQVWDNLTAQNAAREGVESVRKIINTNLIRYAQKECWNFDSDNQSIPCENSKRLSGSYRLEYSITSDQFTPKLAPTGANLDLSQQLDTNKEYLLSNYIQNNNSFYTYISSPPEDKKTKFYRMIKISYEAIGKSALENKMIITSTVQWMQGNNKKEFIMTNYIVNKY